MVFAPRKTLIWPGTLLALLGAAGTALLVRGPFRVGSVTFDINTLVYTCLAILVGAQLLLFGGFAEIYGWHEGIVHDRRVARWTKILQLERLVGIGLILILVGLVGTIIALAQWSSTGFRDLDARGTIRVVLVSATAIGLGTTGIFSGFFSSLLTLRGARPRAAPVTSPEAELIEA